MLGPTIRILNMVLANMRYSPHWGRQSLDMCAEWLSFEEIETLLVTV